MTTNDGLSRAEIKLGFGRLLDEISDEVFNESWKSPKTLSPSRRHCERLIRSQQHGRSVMPPCTRRSA